MPRRRRLHKEDPREEPAAPIYCEPRRGALLRSRRRSRSSGSSLNDPDQGSGHPTGLPARRGNRLPRPGHRVSSITRSDHDGEEGDEFEELQPYEQEFETIITACTPGQLVLNTILPYPLKNSDEFLHVELNKKQLSEMILTVHRRAGVGATIRLLDDMKDMGFKWATRYGLSVAITDMDPPARREEMIKEADDRSTRITVQFRRGMLTYNEMTQTLVKLWTDTYNEIGNEIVAGLTQLNPLSIVTVSGARGSVKQLAQLAGMRGLMFNQFNEVIYELPVKSSFHKGLGMLEYFVTTHGARKGLADTALRTADAGYLTRRLCDVAQDVIVKSYDCGTSEGILAHRIVDQGEAIEQISDRIFGRVSLAVITDPDTGEELDPVPGADHSRQREADRGDREQVQRRVRRGRDRRMRRRLLPTDTARTASMLTSTAT